MLRTTLTLDEMLYKQARKKAIDNNIPFRRIVNDALKAYLTTPKQKVREFKFKSYAMGEIRGKLTRRELYENL